MAYNNILQKQVAIEKKRQRIIIITNGFSSAHSRIDGRI